jgi:hypothetical protein
MKNLFITTAVLGLIACNSHEDPIVIHPCCTDATDLPFEIDSIKNVGQLLDSLNAVRIENQ